ncbi:50S ribosomal protein L14 [Methanocella sp. CWC-04]|uniref:Large ribosomal subunit protein uL14 n=1 Tax=Methanooceanicella nereidis TaxID=2052831 RepID=A0AAP2W4L4_9EURY|nr:50S ribosomal protein L14 [Methanocella sp. CWC-04]
MKAIKAKVPRSVHTATRLDVADNSGARVVEVISVLKYRGRKNRMPRAGLGDILIASVKKGTPEMRKQIVRCVIVRQKKEFRRPNGMRVSFEDNACVVVDDNNDPKGTEIKGPVAREVAERYAKIGSTATIIV